MNTMKNKLAFKIKSFYINLWKKNEIVYKFLTCFVIFLKMANKSCKQIGTMRRETNTPCREFRQKD